MPRAHITYTALNQPLSLRDSRRNYDSVVRFLQEATDWSGMWDTSKVGIFEPGQFIPTPYDYPSLFSDLADRLGPATLGGSISPWKDAGTPQHQWTFLVGPSHHVWALALALDQPVRSRSEAPGLTYSLSAKVRLRSFRVDGVPPDTTFPASELTITVSSSTVVLSGELVFPFPSASAEFLACVEAIRPLLRVRIAKSEFRLHSPAAIDEWNIRRIPTGFFDGI